MSIESPVAGMASLPAAGSKPLPPHGSLRRAMGDRRTGRPRCHCDTCRMTERRYEKRRHFLAVSGRSILVDSAPAREHLTMLREAGDSLTGIAERYSLSRYTLHKISCGLWPRINAATEAKILAIHPGTATDDHRSVSAVGARRRVRALMAAGHSLNAIKDAVGMQHNTASVLVNGRHPTIKYELNERVKAGYLLLAGSRGESVRSLRRAEREGWPDPVWWEDMGRIDDPEFDPDTAERELNHLEEGELRAAEILHLASFGSEAEEIAARLGLGRDYVVARLRKLREAS